MNKLLVGAAILLGLFASGCQSTRQITDYGPRYQPTNIVAVAKLPKSVRRVALLPLGQHREGSALSEGAEHLSVVLETELRKMQAFEIVRVSPQQLLQWTGRSAWRADQALPTNLVSRVRAETGCDAVIFATLTAFRPYPPLAVGWDLRLVEIESQKVLWAVDEVLDAGAAPVARAAKDYSEAQLYGGRAADDTTVLHSPQRFGQFAAATLAATLPPR